MIKLELKVAAPGYDVHKNVICPHCGHEHSFYYYSPLKCRECYKRLPDTIFMMDKIDGRFEYYKTGKARLFEREEEQG